MAANNTSILCLSSEKSEVKNQSHCVKAKVSAGLVPCSNQALWKNPLPCFFQLSETICIPWYRVTICIFKVVCVPPSYLMMTLTLLFLSCLCDYITPLDKPAQSSISKSLIISTKSLLPYKARQNIGIFRTQVSLRKPLLFYLFRIIVRFF